MSGRDDDARHKPVEGLTRTETIALLNDALRRHRITGKVTITAGVAALGEEALPAILQRVATYDRFDEANDPYGERDFGQLVHQGHSIFWKIDYYDTSMAAGSINPANPAVTVRVLTIMLAEEY